MAASVPSIPRIVGRRRALELLIGGGGLAVAAIASMRPTSIGPPPGSDVAPHFDYVLLQGLVNDLTPEAGKIWYRADLDRLRASPNGFDVKSLSWTDDPPAVHNILSTHNGFPGGTTDFLRADGSFATPPGGSSDHGLLSGLGDDDHPQYETSAEAQAKVDAHAGAADPHVGYQKETEKGAASGYASLDASTLLPVAQLPAHDILTKHNGFPGGGTFLRADGTWASPPGGSEAFPVGSVFIAVVATNPGTLLGYGTWVAFAVGRMLVGLDSGDPDFDVVEETGGAKTHTHAGHAAHVVTQPSGHTDHADNIAHTHTQRYFPTATGGSIGYTVDTSMSGTQTNTGLTTASSGTGSSLAHSAHAGTAVDAHSAHDSPDHKPPYIVVYMWKRTA
jgi:hypothetical protein